jgi:hypothetical protein
VRHDAAQAAFDRAFAQQRGRVVPERLREGVAHIGAGDADIRQHVPIEAGEHARLAPMPYGAGELLEPMRHQSQQGRKSADQGAARDG